MSKDSKKLVHEEVYDKFGIDSNNLDTRNNPSEFVPHEWYKDIIEKCINNLNFTPDSKQIDENVTRLEFPDKETAEKFKQKFNENLMKYVNKFIREDIGDKPQKYNRNFMIAFNEDSHIVEMEY